MRLLYTIVVHLTYFLMIPAAWFNKKARFWVQGRKNWKEKLLKWDRNDPVYWFHAASLGEFEQGLPVMEALKKAVPECSIVVSFFSPSGYEVKKNYKHADLVFYLPLDTRYNARTLISILNPDTVFFIKYEFWPYHLDELRKRHIPVYLLSGIFRPSQLFFKWYGSWFRENLRAFNHLFVQNTESLALLSSIGFKNSSITGDTRFDRVADHAASARDIPLAREFAEESICIVAGSTWPEDEDLLTDFINHAPPLLRFIIAPHEIHRYHLDRLNRIITKKCVLFSQAAPEMIRDHQVLIIDNIGMLASIYRYGKIAYIGGGFGKGIHNILEAAVYGIPVIFGPNHQKFQEANELITAGGGFSVAGKLELNQVMENLIPMNEFYRTASERAGNYIITHTGSTERIMEHLKNDLVLKNMEAI